MAEAATSKEDAFFAAETDAVNTGDNDDETSPSGAKRQRVE